MKQYVRMYMKQGSDEIAHVVTQTSPFAEMGHVMSRDSALDVIEASVGDEAGGGSPIHATQLLSELRVLSGEPSFKPDAKNKTQLTKEKDRALVN